MASDDTQLGAGQVHVPAHILASFGVASATHPMDEEWSGGWRCDRAVLSPADEPARATWIAKVMAMVRPAGSPYRDRFLRVMAGSACPAGERGRSCQAIVLRALMRWPRQLCVSMKLCEGSRGAVMDEDPLQNPFAAADAAAFADDPTEVVTSALGADSIPTSAAEALAKAMSLIGLRGPVEAPDQVVHGDVAGCVIFDGAADPVLTDFVPAYHPAGWSVALLIVDCMAWGNAPDTLLQRWAHVQDFEQLALRAVIYRLFAHAMLAEQANPQSLPGLLRVADVIAAKIEQS